MHKKRIPSLSAACATYYLLAIMLVLQGASGHAATSFAETARSAHASGAVDVRHLLPALYPSGSDTLLWLDDVVTPFNLKGITMRLQFTVGALFAAALFASSAGSLAATPKETLAAFHAAISSGDKAKATSLLAPEITIYESGYAERSREEYAGHHFSGDMEFAKSATRKVLKQTERIDGETAVAWEENETAGTARGKPVHAFGTETAVLEKNGDNWTIEHCLHEKRSGRQS